MAASDAVHKTCEDRMGMDETMFINILVSSPAERVRNINNAFLAKYKTDIAGAIKQEFFGDAKLALVFLVRSPFELLVKLLPEQFEMTPNGGGNKAFQLSAWVTTEMITCEDASESTIEASCEADHSVTQHRSFRYDDSPDRVT
ncbi:Annexin (Annexin) Family [Phytophthora palmivora]|uniref:Annexin (Annexin) Family n=1 Tax=Phytophthora palmivora TaxID=4796 RepID=A0A2P4YTI9_9STRA|nr:Annexin (Annexin) Family [Phytophthora palmivora]